MEHITIKDIAKKSGFSVSTISRAFNDKYDIKKETRELILDIAKEMGYHPNPIAKNLLKQCTHQIGVVVPEFINSFFMEVVEGIQDVLIENGYQVLLMQSGESAETELHNVEALTHNMVDGIILSICSERKENMDFYNSLLTQNFPLVLFNRGSDKINTDMVLFDDYKWAFFATEHLIDQGFKKIYHFSGPSDLLFAKNRKQGFTDALKKHGLYFEGTTIIEAGLLIGDGEREMQTLISCNNFPEAIFAVNDPCAVGAMKALKRHGIKIPEQIALFGFTESKLAALLDPPLSSVEQPTREIGIAAANLMLEQITSKEPRTTEKIILNGKLNIRESSKLKNIVY